MIKILLFLLFFTFINAIEPTTACGTCPVGSSWTSNTTTIKSSVTYTDRDAPYDVALPAPTQSCSFGITKDFYSEYADLTERYSDISNKTFYTFKILRKQISSSCQTNPVCTAPQVLDESVYPPVCSDTSCPPGQHDDLSSTEYAHCVCDTGYPVYDLMTSGIKECVQPTCPPVSPQKSLPLKMENIDYATCAKLFNPVMGFDFEFQEDPNSALTCCWSDSIKTPDGNGTESDCGLNKTLDNNGNCVDIPDLSNSCPAEQFYSYIEGGCVPIYPDADNNQSQGGSNDGVNGNGSIREDGDDTFYNGGGSESNESEKILLEYNNDEADDMLNAYSNTLVKKFVEFIKETGVDILKLYTISIPVMPSCGCENITYDFNLLNAQRSGTIEICSPMARLFAVLKPILWFFFLVGMLFNFFMGRTN